MLARASRLLLVSGLILACAQAGYASFIGDISMGDDGLGDPNNVAPGTPITLDVAAAVTYTGAWDSSGTNNPGDDIQWIQLRFDDSSAALSLSGASWSWDSDTSVLGTTDTDMSDYIVSCQGAVSPGITATSFDLGVLSFNAPAALGTYTVELTGGDINTEPSPDNTLMADGLTVLYEDNGLTLGTFSFTVVPEPGTAALLACGALAALLRRRKAKT